jgi:hypothetical protein
MDKWHLIFEPGKEMAEGVYQGYLKNLGGGGANSLKYKELRNIGNPVRGNIKAQETFSI